MYAQDRSRHHFVLIRFALESRWYPEHWEYCKAHFSPGFHTGKSWLRALDEIMPYGYQHDLMVEKRLSDLIVGAT
jgi:hypothetical protein